jgi:hypothetical protein
MRWETLEVNPALAPDPSRPGRASAWPIKARDNKPAAAIVIACVVLIGPSPLSPPGKQQGIPDLVPKRHKWHFPPQAVLGKPPGCQAVALQVPIR